MPSTELTELQQRILNALQVNGRAPWTRIAAALSAPERTVTRNGNELLRSGRVIIAGMAREEHQVILRCATFPGAAALVSETLTRREDVTYSYQTSGEDSVVAELQYRGGLHDLLDRQLPAVPGLRLLATFPVLRYFKTIRAWRGGALSDAEALSLADRSDATRKSPAQANNGSARANGATAATLSTDQRATHDAALIDALRDDGRRSIESLARLLKMSESSIARRIEWLQASGVLSIRALIDPADLGYPVEAMLWVRLPPDQVEPLGKQLQLWPHVRYVAAIAGTEQLLVNLTARSHSELFSYLGAEVWRAREAHIRTDLVHTAGKRGGRVLARAAATSPSGTAAP